jgi:transposase
VARPRRHLILDNASTQKTPAIQRWLVAHPRFVLHFTPTSSSWLNLGINQAHDHWRRIIDSGH